MRHILNFLEEAVLKKIERKSLYYNDDQYSFSEIKHNSLIISSKIPQYILGQLPTVFLIKRLLLIIKHLLIEF